ncbi:hypothetical protein KIK84_05570 [Curvibacter sp. CHRR-16]|uniref:hypothetical protein n=1 Tax=Curvibacter sp. CHRR-16 TaxID=2835872 RepID=UPI001BD93790|nr:hypothetical protein [Curvibacter sp. CHRR-16]MBT0569785.1 hypothetical protein [Curvibacter sp. CHRR-16]
MAISPVSGSASPVKSSSPVTAASPQSTNRKPKEAPADVAASDNKPKPTTNGMGQTIGQTLNAQA